MPAGRRDKLGQRDGKGVNYNRPDTVSHKKENPALTRGHQCPAPLSEPSRGPTRPPQGAEPGKPVRASWGRRALGEQIGTPAPGGVPRALRSPLDRVTPLLHRG